MTDLSEGARLKAIAKALRKATGTKTNWGAALAAASGIGGGALAGAYIGSIRTVGNPIGSGVGAGIGALGSAYTLYKNTRDEMTTRRAQSEELENELSFADREIIINEMNDGDLVEDFADEWELIKEFVCEHTLVEQPDKSYDHDHWDHKAYHFRDKMKGLMVAGAGGAAAGATIAGVGNDPKWMAVGGAMGGGLAAAGAAGYAASAVKSGVKGAYRFFKGKKTTSVRESNPELRSLLDAAFDEKPAEVETHFNTAFASKVAELVAERKADLASSLFNGGDEDEDDEEEDIVEPSEEEEVADEAEVADDFDFGDIDLDDIDFDEETPDVDDVTEDTDELSEERKGAAKIVDSFLARKAAKLKNDHTDGSALYLHGNKIAWHGDNGEVHATHAGWNTTTTRERLNTLSNRVGGGKRFYTKKGQLHHGDNPISSRDVVNLKEGTVTEGEVVKLADRKASSYAKDKPKPSAGESFGDKIKRFKSALPKD